MHLLRAPLVHERGSGGELGDLGLLLFVLAQLLLIAPLFFHSVEGVIAGVEHRPAPVDLNDALHHTVQKVTVVGDGKDGALKGIQILLQPLCGAEVQMVGGLIQQQDVRVLQNEPGQVDPGLLAAGELIEELLAHCRRDFQAVADLAQTDGGIVAALSLKALRQIVVAGEGGLIRLPCAHSGSQIL